MTTTTPTVGLYWFRDDLRLDDNPGLKALAGHIDRLVCCYVVDEGDFERAHYGFAPMGEHRWTFISESLQALDAELRALGNALQVHMGDPVKTILRLCDQHRVRAIGASEHSGYYEQRQLADVLHQRPDIEPVIGHAQTLFALEDLPFEPTALPPHFTPFRRQVDNRAWRSPQPVPTSLPPPDVRVLHTRPPKARSSGSPWHGGERAAREHLDRYLFGSRAVSHYKQTRNALDDWPSSSKLSPWLANGCLSPARVAEELRRFEVTIERNESTEWLYQELLWREFFHWHTRRHGARVFAFSGTRRRRPLTTYYPARLRQWCAGDTPFPIVNACMRQLNATGYMSNRGRQLVASCLVHEFECDWRYGAAYFQQQLIDHDVAVNWGNWQYLAGVGADPRGHRHFDLRGQAERYDPDGAFTARWAPGHRWGTVDDHVDAADWPLAP